MSEETHKKEHKPHDDQHLEKLTVKELREMAAEFPHERAIHDMSKEELVSFIKAAKGIKDDPHVHRHKIKGKVKMTKPELKSKIRELKIQSGQALEDRDEKKLAALRHRIIRLKKISRRLAKA